MSKRLAVSLLLAAAACRSVPFHFEAERGGPVSRFRLIAARGARINARLKPALELPHGTVLRFDSPYLTRDSAYFAGVPIAEGALPEEAHRGVVRASVCPEHERLCRTYEVVVRW